MPAFVIAVAESERSKTLWHRFCELFEVDARFEAVKFGAALVMRLTKATIFLSAIVLFAGCEREPETAYDRAAKAQSELEEAREEAAEKIAEAEEDAVERIQKAREKSRHEIEQAQQEATEMVEEAKQKLERELQALSDAPLRTEVEVETKTPVDVDGEIVTATEEEAATSDTP